MHAQCSNPGSVASAHGGDESKSAHLLYQSATVLVIVLFLISFW